MGYPAADPAERIDPALERAAEEWLSEMGASVSGPIREFAPRTLKQALDQALGLGAAVGRLDEAMWLLADIERRLGRLAASLGRDRRVDTVDGRPAPPAAIVTAVEGETLVLGGHWIPGLAAVAGLTCVGVSEGQPDVRVDAAGLASLQPRDVIFALAGMPLAAAGGAVEELKAGPLLSLDAVAAGRVHVVDGERYVVSPGPRVVRSAELLAFVVHGARSGVTPGADEVLAGNVAGRE